MPIIATDLMPNVRYETWEGTIAPTELYASQDRFIEQMEAEGGAFYVVIVEPRSGVILPPLSVIVNSSKRYQRDKVRYLIIHSSRFNMTIASMASRFTPFPVTMCHDLPSAVEEARRLLAEHGISVQE
jgi:hypothetical protein